MKRARGFTLVELLVVTAIVTTLAALAFVGYHEVRERARMANEVNAARNLIAGYLGYAAEHNGRLLEGYKTDPEATDFDGNLLHHPVNARYPWRLAPYLGTVEGVLFLNGNERVLDMDDEYLVSVSPNLGINAVFVGGHYGSGSPLRPTERVIDAVGRFHAARLVDATRPQSLVTFASARSSEGLDGVGYFEIRPPQVIGPEWSGREFDPEAAASDHGFVDFRWNDKAVAAMLAGNVEVLDEEELRDMRRWSPVAARLDDPDYRVSAR